MSPAPRRVKVKAPHPRSLAEFCALFDQEAPANAVRLGNRWFFDPRGVIADAKGHGWEPFSGGLYLGEEKNGFRATSALVTMLAEHCDRAVALEEKSAWLFLCGRDVLMEGVFGSPSFRQGELVFVTSEDGAVLGYGMILNEFNPNKKHAVFVKHLLDRGEYLRRER